MDPLLFVSTTRNACNDTTEKACTRPKYAAGAYHPLRDRYIPEHERETERVLIPRFALMESTGIGLRIVDAYPMRQPN